MKISFKIAILFVGIWFLGKMTFFYAQILQSESEVKFQVMWNILCLLLAMSIGTLAEKRRQANTDNSALADIKNTLGGGMIYTVLVSGLIYLYYAKLDPGYNQRQLAIAEMRVDEMLKDEGQMAELRKSPDYESKTDEEIRELAIANQEAIYNPTSTMTISLLGMLLLSTINAIILTFVFRRILFRN